MKKLLLASAIALCAQGAQAVETPKACVARLGSTIECFSAQASYAVEYCSVLRSNEISRIELGMPPDADKTSATCISTYKKNLKDHYAAVVKSTTKKPAAQQAAKKVLITAYSILDNLPGSRQANDTFQSALSELEVEAQ